MNDGRSDEQAATMDDQHHLNEADEVKRKHPSPPSSPSQPPTKRIRHTNREVLTLTKTRDKLFHRKQTKIVTLHLDESFTLPPITLSDGTESEPSKKDVIKVASMEYPLLPISRDVLSFQSQLESTRARLTSNLNDISTNSTVEDTSIFDKLDDVGQALNEVTLMIDEICTWREENRGRIELVESVRLYAKKVVEASRNIPAQLVLWTKIVTKCNLLLRLVDGEKEAVVQQQQDGTDVHQSTAIKSECAPPSNKSSTKHIPQDKFTAYINGGAKSSHPPITNHTLYWDNGKVYCKACGNQRIRQLKNLYRHTMQDGHLKNMQQQKVEYISFEGFIRQLDSGGANNMLYHTLRWASNGRVYCVACNQGFRHLNKLMRHVEMQSHIDCLEIYKAQEAQTGALGNNNSTDSNGLLEAIKESKAKAIKVADEPKPPSDANHIPYPKFLKMLNNWRESDTPLHNQSLEWNEGKVCCIACGHARILQLKNLRRHTEQKGHVKNLAVLEASGGLICDGEGVEAAVGDGIAAVSYGVVAACESNDGEDANAEAKVELLRCNNEPDKSYVTYERFMAQLFGGKHHSHSPIHDQSFEWNDGKVFCIACKYTQIKQLKNLKRHTEQEGHKRNLAGLVGSVLFQGLKEGDEVEMGHHVDEDIEHDVDGDVKMPALPPIDAMETDKDEKVEAAVEEEAATTLNEETFNYSLSNGEEGESSKKDDDLKLAQCRGEINEVDFLPLSQREFNQPAPIEKSDKNYITHQRFLIQLNGGSRNSHAAIHDQTLAWSNGAVYCKCCGNQRIRHLRNLYRHTQNPVHQRNLKLTHHIRETERLADTLLTIGTTNDADEEMEAPEDENSSDCAKAEVFIPGPLEISDKDYITKERFLNQLNGGTRCSHAAIHDQSFEWAGGVVYCKCCGNKRIKHVKNMFRHTQNPIHLNNLQLAQLKLSGDPPHASEAADNTTADGEVGATNDKQQSTDMPKLPTPTPLEISNKDYITEERFLSQLNGGTRSSHASILDQSLEWAGGIVYCKCCGNQRIKHLKNLFRHTQHANHKRNLACFVDGKSVQAFSEDESCSSSNMNGNEISKEQLRGSTDTVTADSDVNVLNSERDDTVKDNEKVGEMHDEHLQSSNKSGADEDGGPLGVEPEATVDHQMKDDKLHEEPLRDRPDSTKEKGIRTSGVESRLNTDQSRERLFGHSTDSRADVAVENATENEVVADELNDKLLSVNTDCGTDTVAEASEAESVSVKVELHVDDDLHEELI